MAAERVIGTLGNLPLDSVSSGVQPLTDVLQPLIQQLLLLAGGIAGLYLLLLLTRVYYERKKVRILDDIRYDLDHLNIYYDIPASRHRLGIFKRFFHWLFRKQEPDAESESHTSQNIKKRK
ncbi:hypothetical protein HYX14_03495 [Candidatus Woesearchaeota archaeon]|nr:hypothetical protein [Candidatus Woesearchaeota archaeon]